MGRYTFPNQATYRCNSDLCAPSRLCGVQQFAEPKPVGIGEGTTETRRGTEENKELT